MPTAREWLRVVGAAFAIILICVAALAAGLVRMLGDEGPAFGGEARRRCLDRFEMGVVGARWAGLVAEVVAGRATIRDH